MTNSDFLRMRYLMRRIPRLKWDIEREMSNATKITATITGMPHGSGNHSKVEDSAIILATVKDAYREVIAELKQLRETLEPYIDNLEDPDERAAMRMRYMHGLSPEAIAVAICRSDRMVYVYLNRAEKRIIRMTEKFQ